MKSQEMRDVLRAKGFVPAGVLLDLGVQMTAAEDRQRSKIRWTERIAQVVSMDLLLL